MEIKAEHNDSYKATFIGLSVRVDATEERYITSIVADGTSARWEAIPYSKIGGLRYSSVITAYYSDPYYCYVDMDCGTQRWRGYMSLIKLRKCLYALGFSKRQVDSIVRKLKRLYFSSQY